MKYHVQKTRANFAPVQVSITLEDKWEFLEFVKRLDISTASLDRFYNKDDDASYPDVYRGTNNKFHALWSDLDDIYESISHLYEEDEQEDENDRTIEIDTDDLLDWLNKQDEVGEDEVKVGDAVEVVGHFFNHGFKIGEIVTIELFHGTSGNGCNIWEAKSLRSGEEWYVSDKDIKKIKS